jgi:hypothetical protein
LLVRCSRSADGGRVGGLPRAVQPAIRTTNQATVSVAFTAVL